MKKIILQCEVLIKIGRHAFELPVARGLAAIQAGVDVCQQMASSQLFDCVRVPLAKSVVPGARAELKNILNVTKAPFDRDAQRLQTVIADPLSWSQLDSRCNRLEVRADA